MQHEFARAEYYSNRVADVVGKWETGEKSLRYSEVILHPHPHSPDAQDDNLRFFFLCGRRTGNSKTYQTWIVGEI